MPMTVGEKNPNRYTRFHKIDHIAIAVVDLEEALEFFEGILGFQLMQRRTVQGARTGMISAELEHNGIKFVLCQGTESESQVSKLIASSGPGVAHIALAVDDVEMTKNSLGQSGLNFDTSVIAGNGLKQVFSSRDRNSGLSFEFIERNGEVDGFREENINALFEQLERSGAY